MCGNTLLCTSIYKLMASMVKIGWCSLIALLLVSIILLLMLSFTSTGLLEQRTGSSVQSVSVMHKLVRKIPRCHAYSDDSVATDVLSKELVLRRVYFDHRKRDGYNNATVFLMEAKGTDIHSKLFSGCRVGPYFSDKFRFRFPRNYKWVQIHKNAKSSLAIIDCYNIRGVKSGDSASLYYSSFTSGLVVEIQSHKPVLVPEPMSALNRSTVTVVACVGIIRTGEHSPSEHGMLYSWLRYQKVIGVDHVHMIVENNFVRAGGLKNEFIQQVVREGYLSIDFWPAWLNFTEIYNSQKLAYQDCLYRFQGVYDYIVYADSDDFFVPLKKNTSIKDYLVTWCSGKAGTCRFKWQWFHPDCGWDPNSVGADGNFTAAMTYKRITKARVTKSAHQLKALVDAGTHEAMVLLDGYVQADVPVSEAYFAHVRFGNKPKGGC